MSSENYSTDTAVTKYRPLKRGPVAIVFDAWARAPQIRVDDALKIGNWLKIGKKTSSQILGKTLRFISKNA